MCFLSLVLLFFEVLEAPGTKTVYMCRMLPMYTFNYLHIMRYDETQKELRSTCGFFCCKSVFWRFRFQIPAQACRAAVRILWHEGHTGVSNCFNEMDQWQHALRGWARNQQNYLPERYGRPVSRAWEHTRISCHSSGRLVLGNGL